jgi:hypothetical protein
MQKSGSKCSSLRLKCKRHPRALFQSVGEPDLTHETLYPHPFRFFSRLRGAENEPVNYCAGQHLAQKIPIGHGLNDAGLPRIIDALDALLQANPRARNAVAGP